MEPIDAPLLLIGLSPALGRVILLPALNRGEVNRATGYLEVVAGKATNTARVARQMGRDAILVTPLGEEHRRQFITTLLSDASAPRSDEELFPAAPGGATIDVKAVPYTGRIRWALTLVEEPEPRGSNTTVTTEVVINEPNPVPADVAPLILNEVRDHIDGAAACVIAGSRLPDLPPTLLSDIVRMACAAGIPLFFDMRGADLLRALAARDGEDDAEPSGVDTGSHANGKPPNRGHATCPIPVVKINEEEFLDTAGQAGLTAGDAPESRDNEAKLSISRVLSFARRFRCVLVVTRGPAPVLYADVHGAYGEVPVPTVPARNPIGSGDTLLAALAVRLTEGVPLAAAVDEAVRLASRNVRFLTPGTLIGP